MGLEIFTSSGSFNPSNYGLKAGDLIQVLVVGGGGSGTWYNNLGVSGESSSFGSIATAQGGTGADGQTGGTGSTSGGNSSLGGGGGGGGYVPYCSIPRSSGSNAGLDSYGNGGSGGAEAVGVHTFSMFGGSGGDRGLHGSNGWLPFGGSPALGGHDASYGGGGGAGSGYGAGGGGRGATSNNTGRSGGGGGAGYITTKSHILESMDVSNGIAVTIGEGGDIDPSVASYRGASGLVIVTW